MVGKARQNNAAMSSSNFARALSPACAATLIHRGVTMEDIQHADFGLMRRAGVEPGSRLHEGIIDAARKCGPDLHSAALESFPENTPVVPRRE